MADQEWLTIAQAATRAGISPARIRQLLHKKQIAFVRSKPGAHDTRIDPVSLADWQTHRTRGRPPGRQATIPRQVEPAPVCICCSAPLPARRGRPPKEGARCLDCLVVDCKPGALCRRRYPVVYLIGDQPSE